MTELKSANELRKAIRAKRRADDISQGELADDCGISKNTVLSFEMGQDNTGIDSVLKMITNLGLKIYIV